MRLTGKNVEYIGTNVSIKFPQIHKVTGCDTTSFLLSVGKNVLTSLTEVSVRLYKQIKTKTSQSLPPYKKSMLQAFKCILYYVYDWSRVDEANISDILLQNGWIVNDENEEF